MRLLEATDTFIEALQQISEAKGRDDPDEFERAVNAIKHMQRMASHRVANWLNENSALS